MKKTIMTIMAITCLIGLTAASSQAGSSKRERLEQFIIGSHVGFLGAVIANQVHNNRPVVYVPEKRHHKEKRHYRSNRHRHDRHYRSDRHRHDRHYRSDRHRHNRTRGHWEVKKRWVEPEYEKRWNPGHYNKKGVWKRGRYQKIVVREGYWKEKRIWVARY
jgi:hypothetical protein